MTGRHHRPEDPPAAASEGRATQPQATRSGHITSLSELQVPSQGGAEAHTARPGQEQLPGVCKNQRLHPASPRESAPPTWELVSVHPERKGAWALPRHPGL